MPLPCRPVAVGPHAVGVEPLAQTVFAKLVVHLSLLGISEHFVGVIDLLEAVFDLLVPGVLVRMQLPRELSVSLLDGVGFSAFGYAEYGVEIFGHRSSRGERMSGCVRSQREPRGAAAAPRCAQLLAKMSAARGTDKIKPRAYKRRRVSSSRSPGRSRVAAARRIAPVTLMFRLSTNPRIGTFTSAVHARAISGRIPSLSLPRTIATRGMEARSSGASVPSGSAPTRGMAVSFAHATAEAAL